MTHKFDGVLIRRVAGVKRPRLPPGHGALMFMTIIMERDVTCAIVLANIDDKGADADIRPLPPGPKLNLALEGEKTTPFRSVLIFWASRGVPPKGGEIV